MSFKIHSNKDVFGIFSDTSNSGRFCEARNLTLECKDVTGDDGTTKSQITVGFDVLLKNKEDGAIHPSCVDRTSLHTFSSSCFNAITLSYCKQNTKKNRKTWNVCSYFLECKRQNLRGMLGNAINLTKEMEELLKDKAIGIDTGNGNPTPVTNTGVDRTRPKMFCIAPGRVLTRTYLCGKYFLHFCCLPYITVTFKCFNIVMFRRKKFDRLYSAIASVFSRSNSITQFYLFDSTWNGHDNNWIFL